MLLLQLCFDDKQPKEHDKKNRYIFKASDSLTNFSISHCWPIHLVRQVPKACAWVQHPCCALGNVVVVRLESKAHGIPAEGLLCSDYCAEHGTEFCHCVWWLKPPNKD